MEVKFFQCSVSVEPAIASSYRRYISTVFIARVPNACTVPVRPLKMDKAIQKYSHTNLNHFYQLFFSQKILTTPRIHKDGKQHYSPLVIHYKPLYRLIARQVQKQVDVLPSKNQALCKLNHTAI